MKSHCGGLCRLFLILVLFNVGCTKVGPDYLRPPVQVSKDWQDAGDKRVKEIPRESREWWEVFNDSTLNRLIGTAYSGNLSLQTAGTRVLQARAQLGIAIGSQFPQSQQMTGLVQYNRLSDRSASAASSSVSGFVPELSYLQSQIGPQVSWELDFWGKFRRAIESSDASLLAAIADYDNTLVTLTADVANAYVQIRTIQERARIATENVKIQLESLQIADTRFRGGTTSQRDVEQAKTVLASTQATIPQLEKQLRQAENGLCILLGVPPSDLSETLAGANGIPVPPPEVVVGIPTDLLSRRPDVRSAEALAAAQCAQIGVAKADLFPSLSLFGSFGFQSTDLYGFALGDMFRGGSRMATFGPTLQWNVFNYGQITNNVRLQDAKFQQMLISYQNTVLTAQREVEDSLIAFLRDQEQAKFLTESADAAARSVNLAVLQYREGIADFTTVLTAQQALLQQQDNLATTLGDISLSLVGVYRALGGGWEIREGRDFISAPTRKIMTERTNWGHLLEPGAAEPAEPGKPQGIIRTPDW